MRARYLAPADLRTVEALTALQLGYDACFREDGGVDANRAADFIAFVAGLDPDHPPDAWPGGWEDAG